jgi:hypothetical protein
VTQIVQKILDVYLMVLENVILIVQQPEPYLGSLIIQLKLVYQIALSQIALNVLQQITVNA